MRNLFLFLQRYYLFFLFLFLEIIAFILVYYNNSYHKASILNTSNGLSGWFYETSANFTDYFKLRSVNDSLQEENAKLRARLLESNYDNRLIAASVNDTSLLQKYTYITAKVVNNSVNKRNNYLTLNKGRKHGLRPQMGVISNQGVVGIVLDVSEYYCTVLSLLNSNTKISARIEESNGIGSLIWDGEDPYLANLLDVNKHEQVEQGQRIVTSGFSTIFPENQLIGTVEEVSLEPGENFYDIKVRLSNDFSRLTFTYIVNNLMKEEITELENTIDLDQ